MRPQGTAQQLEKRRRQAIRLLKARKNLSAVARALSASVSSVFRWYQAYQAKGLRGLQPQPTPGRPPKLSPSQKRKLVKVLLKGPLAAGYRTDLWTLKRVAEVIKEHFGVDYHPWPRLEASIKPGMELSETGAPGTPKGRRINRSLEALPLAPYKKNRKTWGPSGLPG